MRPALTRCASSARTVDVCPVRSFAAAHPEAARRVLSVPAFTPPPPIEEDDGGIEFDNPIVRGGSLEEYLRWRGWDVGGALDSDLRDNDDAVRSAIGLLSHPLTFPLTLGRHLAGFRGREREGGRRRGGGILRLTIEMSLANSDDDIEGRRGLNSNFRLTMNYHPSFLHEVVLEFRKSSLGGELEGKGDGRMTTPPWHGYALFNPGFGHPNLKSQWGQTLKFLLRTGKPMLITAHSITDAARDRAILEETLADASSEGDGDGHSSRGESSPRYAENPYASRMRFVDPFPFIATSGGRAMGGTGDVHDVVRPNHSVLFLR
ncbi:hypothetical protein ACHAW5_001464 [Stephanodiscus triporus]|uniref:Mitochondrial splicing suppressor 51-like C-terminal domain-containing protein n=1 Tax=Stephanodiscus triporus TaxID=2934178 RepID=A0ABD3N4L4_9STRA